MKPLKELFETLDLTVITQHDINAIKLSQQSATLWAVAVIGHNGEEYAGGIIEAPEDQKEHLRKVWLQKAEWETSLSIDEEGTITFM